MPKSKLFRNIALSALLLGAICLAANLYLGAHSHPKLATLLFALAVMCDMVFAVCTVIWVYWSMWEREPERPTPQMPGAGPVKKPPQS